MRAPKETPREYVARILTDTYGIQTHAEDIWWVKGFYAQTRADCTERWRVVGSMVETGRKVEITGIDSLTECKRRGFDVEKAEPNDGVYGDYVASAKTAAISA